MFFLPTRTELLIAWRYLRARKAEGFISVIAGFSFLGIALGVGTLIVVMAVMQGFRNELVTHVIGMNGHVIVRGAPEGLDGYRDVADSVRKVADVKAVTPIINGQVLVSAPKASTGALVRGIAPEALKARSLLVDNIKSGDFAGFAAKDSVLIGDKLARRLGVKAGEKITLISPKGTATIAGFVPRIKDYTIAGTFDVGMYEYDNNMIFMPLEAAQVYFRLPGRVSALQVETGDPHTAQATAKQIFEATGQRYYVYDWQRMHAQFFNAIAVQRNVLFLILSLIILIAAFNIISSLIMLVRDKARGVAVLRTLGLPRAGVLRIFFLCGASVGVIGTLCGLLLGLLFSLNIDRLRRWLEGLTDTSLFAEEIYFLSTLPAEVQQGDVIQITLMSLALSFVATLYPAWKAARSEPAEVLRYE